MDARPHTEAVAKAICLARTGDDEAWEITYSQGRDQYRREAQAAIDALDLLRVFSVGMEDAVGDPTDWLGHDDSTWQAARARGLCGDQFIVSRLVTAWARCEDGDV